MSRKVLNLLYQPDPSGPSFGKVADPADFMNSQTFAHDHIERVVRDWLMKNEAGARVSGFGLTLTSGLGLSIAAGEAFDTNGVEYDTYPDGQATALTLATADAAHDRIDLIYATLAKDADANSQFRPYREVRTLAEIGSGVPPYLPQNFNNPTEKQNVVTVAVRQGAPALSPVPQALGANEVALWQVRVPATATSLASGNLTDVRPTVRNLHDAWAQIDSILTSISSTVLNEAMQDMIASFLVASNGVQLTYNDVANLLTLAGVAATGSAMGMMSAADKSKLDAAASTNTPSVIVIRDSNGDFAGRDITAARKVKYPDGSEQVGAVRRETPITLFDSVTGFTTTSSSFGYVLRQGIAFYINLVAEDFIGANFCLETVGSLSAGTSIMEVHPYNVTDAVVLDPGANRHEWTHGIEQIRGAAFSLSGTGRKRLQIRFRTTVGGDTGTLYAARLIINPSYAACGSFGGSCPT